MNPRLTLDPLRIWCVVLLSFMLAATVLADVEEDFNSPTPVLLSERGSTRALAIKAGDWNGQIPKKGDPQALSRLAVLAPVRPGARPCLRPRL